MQRTFLFAVLAFLFVANHAEAQVNATTVEGTDASFDGTAAVTTNFLGTIGRIPNPYSSPLPTDWWSVINIRHRNGAVDGNLWGTQIASGLTYNWNRLFFRAQVSGYWQEWNEVLTTAMPRVLINKPTDDGGTALQVNGGTAAQEYVAKQNTSPLGSRLYSMHDAANRARFAIGYLTTETGSNTGSNFAIYSYDDNGHFMAAPFVIERATGNVGIGVPNPKARLAVGGTILATRVKVSTNPADWPDYVFRADYALPSLASVESYIREHQHLPEIPAAAEIGAEGQDLGEMNKKLLKKVEELTFYLIDQQKQLAAQNKIQAAQQTEIDHLRKTIEKQQKQAF